MNKGKLSDRDYKAMDAMLACVLDAYKAGKISREAVASGLAHIMSALDRGNTGEAVAWFNQEGISHFSDLDDD